MKGENAIMVRWGLPPAGREHRALEVLRGLTEWLAKVEREGRIASFHRLAYETGPLHERAGFVLVSGTRDQIVRFMFSDDYKEELKRVALVTTNLSVDVLEAGGAVKERLEGWDAAVQEMHR